MKFFWIGSLILTIFLINSCTKLNVENVKKELRNYEYSRQVNQEKFARWLNSKDPVIRKLAVETLGRIQDTSTVVLVSNRLKDPDSAVRSAAAFALGQFFDPIAEPYLLEAIRVEADTTVLARIIEALGKCGTQNSFNILKGFLEQKNPRLIQPAAIACGLLSYRGYIPFRNSFILEKLLTDNPSSEVRWRAAYALYRMRSPGSYLNFIKALKDKSPYVRYYSIKGLTELYNIASSPNLKEFQKNLTFKNMTDFFKSKRLQKRLPRLLQDPIWYVRVAALEFIQRTKWSGLKKAVLQATKDEHPHVSTEAIKTLMYYPDSRTKKFLWNLYNTTSDWRRKGITLETLSQVDSLKTLKIISSHFDQYEWPNTVFVIRALENISGAQSIALLKKLAESKIIAQKTLAIEALTNKPVEQNYFLPLLSTHDPAIVTITSIYFSRTKNPEAVPHLIKAYQSFTPPQDLEPMEAILVALDSINTPESINFLKSQVSNPYPPVQKILHSAFKRRNITPPTPVKTSESTAYATRWNFEIPNQKIIQIEFETNRGNFKIELYPQVAPVTVASFISLIKKHFYKGLYFHRVVPGFVIQGGDPRGDGWGGPGYAIPCEYNSIFYERGVLGMAHAGKDTGGSQFFITHLPQPHLNGRYTAFGRVVSGMEVVDQIQIYDKIIDVKILP